MTEQGKRVGKGAGMLGGAALVGLLAAGALTACRSSLLDGAMATWLAALIVTVVFGAIAARPGPAGPQADPGGDAARSRADHRNREGGRAMGEDPNTIRDEIEDTRERMGDTIDALGYKADVKARAKDNVTGKVDSVKESRGLAGTESATRRPDADQVKGQAQAGRGVAQENPLGLAVGAVAVGFLAGLLVPTTARRGREARPDGRPGQGAGQGDRPGGARARQAGRAGAAAERQGDRAAARPGARGAASRTPRSRTRKRPRAPSRMAGIRTSAAPAGAVGVFCYSPGSRSGPRGTRATTFSSGGLVAVAAPAARATPSGSSAERDHEGTTVGQADVREVQDHPPPRAGPRDLPEPATQAAAGLGQAMARIAGVNIPLNKRVEIGLTYIYGIGRPTSNEILAELGISRIPTSATSPTTRSPSCAT